MLYQLSQYPFIENLIDVNITNVNDKQDLIFCNSQQSFINASKNEFSNSFILSTDDSQPMITNPTQFKMMNGSNNPTNDPTTVQNLIINFVDSNNQDVHETLGWLSNTKSIITIQNCIQNQLYAQFTPTNVNTFGSSYQVSVTFLNSNGGTFVAGDMYNFINTPPYTVVE